MQIPFVANRQLPSADLPLPIAPQEWRSATPSTTSVTAKLRGAGRRQRDKDHVSCSTSGGWGATPSSNGGRRTSDGVAVGLDAVRDSLGDRARGSTAAARRRACMTRAATFGGAASTEVSARALAMLRRPEARDPRGYVIPADQPDFPRAVHLINALRENGITVHRATGAFTAGGRQYPAGSWVLKTAQPFRPHILDMFEPQDHPNDFLYPGGPPIPPYDAAGWTLAYQMGVKFDRILDAFDGPFAEVKDWNVRPAPGTVAGGSAAGYVISAQYNDAFPAAVRLVAAGEEVYRLTAPHAGHPAGSFFVAAGASTRARLQPIAAELGMDVAAAPSRPAAAMTRMRAPRVALWDRYGGSMPSGWTRWLLEQKKIPFDVVYASQLDAGDLRAKYDAIVLVDGAIPARDGQAGGFGGGGGGEPRADAVPAEFRAALGNTSVGEDGPAAQDLPRAGRHRHHDRRVDRAGAAPRAAGRRQAGRRAGQGPAARAVLRPGVGAARARGHHAVGGVRHGRGGGRLLRRLAGVHARRGRGGARGEARRLVRLRPAAAQRVGVGGSNTWRGAPPRSRPRSARARSTCSAPRSCTARSRTAPSSSSSTAWRPVPRGAGRSSDRPARPALPGGSGGAVDDDVEVGRTPLLGGVHHAPALVGQQLAPHPAAAAAAGGAEVERHAGRVHGALRRVAEVEAGRAHGAGDGQRLPAGGAVARGERRQEAPRRRADVRGRDALQAHRAGRGEAHVGPPARPALDLAARAREREVAPHGGVEGAIDRGAGAAQRLGAERRGGGRRRAARRATRRAARRRGCGGTA
jgi:hypothetical protein